MHAVRNLALDYPKSALRSGPFTIYLTARSASRGAEAVETLNGDPALKHAGVLAKDGGDTTIKFHALDISEEQSIRDFRDVLKKEHPEGIDAVVNNAGRHIDHMHVTARWLADNVKALQCRASTLTLCAKR
jgi:carbonyl reductase 1